MGDIGQVTDASFDEQVLGAGVPVLVDFSAPWCPPCKAMAAVLNEFARKLDEGVRVVSLDVGSNTRVPALYQIMVVPTVIVFRDGLERRRESGLLSRERLQELVESVTGEATA